MDILYQDNRILVCLKPAGVVSVDQPGGLPDLLRQSLGDPQACVRTVHRLDQAVGGVMVLARSRMAARLLSEQVAAHQLRKRYLAIVGGKPQPEAGTYRDLLLRDRQTRMTRVVSQLDRDVKEAVLSYRVLATRQGRSLVEVALETGRTHQIRCQFAHHGHPLLGDRKYGGEPMEGVTVALWSTEVGFFHPQSGAWMHFRALPPEGAPWSDFLPDLEK